jgi:hypothetical protein
MATSRAGTMSPSSEEVSSVSESPVGASSSAIAPRKPVATRSVNAKRSEWVNTTPTAPVLPLASARAAGSGPT